MSFRLASLPVVLPLLRLPMLRLAVPVLKMLRPMLRLRLPAVLLMLPADVSMLRLPVLVLQVLRLQVLLSDLDLWSGGRGGRWCVLCCAR